MESRFHVVRLLLGLGFGYLLASVVWLAVQNQRLQKHLDLALTYPDQLQELTQSNAEQLRRFEDEKADLNRQLSSAAFQLNNLSNTLQETRQQVDPNDEALRQQAQNEVTQPSNQARTGFGYGPLGYPGNANAQANERIPRLYDSYLNALGIPGTERQRVMEAMVNFGAQRYRKLDELVAGSITREEAIKLFSADALSENLQNSLSATQLEDLRQYDLLLKQDTLREAYRRSLGNTGTDLDGALQEQVTGALIDEILSAENNWNALVAEDGSMRSAYNDRLAAFDRARDVLEPELNEQQLDHLDRFIDAELSGIDVILEGYADGSGRVHITQARIGVENLPQ